jgi:hypothetical protein
MEPSYKFSSLWLDWREEEEEVVEHTVPLCADVMPASEGYPLGETERVCESRNGWQSVGSLCVCCVCCRCRLSAGIVWLRLLCGVGCLRVCICICICSAWCVVGVESERSSDGRAIDCSG